MMKKGILFFLISTCEVRSTIVLMKLCICGHLSTSLSDLGENSDSSDIVHAVEFIASCADLRDVETTRTD